MGSNLAYASWIRREMVAGTDGERTPPSNETSGEMSMRENHDVRVIGIFRSLNCVLSLYCQLEPVSMLRVGQLTSW